MRAMHKPGKITDKDREHAVESCTDVAVDKMEAQVLLYLDNPPAFSAVHGVIVKPYELLGLIERMKIAEINLQAETNQHRRLYKDMIEKLKGR